MKLTGGIIVYIICDNTSNFYYGENSYWLLDDWNDEINNGLYLEVIEGLKVDTSSFSEKMILEHRPQLLIDIDNKKLINHYFDQALENRVPPDWEGIWIDKTNSFYERIPRKFQYWNEENLT